MKLYGYVGEVTNWHKLEHTSGWGADSPENTIEAIKQAAKNGADGVEVDLEFTKDCVAVLIHDDTVDRTTDGKGRITELTYSHVLTLNASNNPPTSVSLMSSTLNASNNTHISKSLVLTLNASNNHPHQ
ncbi:hypothetical protein ScPMuIL_013854 [Solemya velum]